MPDRVSDKFRKQSRDLLGLQRSEGRRHVHIEQALGTVAARDISSRKELHHELTLGF